MPVARARPITIFSQDGETFVTAKRNEKEVASARGERPRAQQNRAGGLTLDDYLHALTDMRRTFNLAEPSLTLQNIEREPGASAASEALVTETMMRHGSEIYAKQHELLDNSGTEIYGEWIRTEVYSGHRIRDDRIKQVLRKALELGLQTLVQLPNQGPKKARPPKLKVLAGTLLRLSGKVKEALEHEEIQARLRILNEAAHEDGKNLLKLSQELDRSAATVRAMAEIKIKRVLSDSQNPQIRWALYFIGWITSSTGSQQYSEVTTLFDAAFAAAGKRAPRWVSRLAIEMNFKRRRRQKWARGISR
jgi:hypothetical protein